MLMKFFLFCALVLATSALAAPEGLSLDRAIKLALANNPELAASRSDLDAATAQVDIAQAEGRPLLAAEAGATRFLDPQRLVAAHFNGEVGRFDDDLYRADVNLRLPLYTGGRVTGEIDAAKALRQGQMHLVIRSQEELVFSLTQTYLSMLAQQQVINSLEFAVSSMEEHHTQVARLLAAQKAARVDLLRVQVRLADLQQTLRKEKNRLTVQKRQLINLLGNDLNPDEFDISGSLAGEPGPVPTPAAALSTALAGRNDYLAARSRLLAQQQRIKVAAAGQLPNLALVGSYGLRFDSDGESQDVGSVGLAMSMPIFAGGGISAKNRREQAIFSAAEERLRKLELQIRLEVESAILDMTANQERLLTTREIIAQARESLRIERMKYDLASGSLTDVLDVQTALLQAETSYVGALADFNLAMARLRLATGEILP